MAENRKDDVRNARAHGRLHGVSTRRWRVVRPFVVALIGATAACGGTSEQLPANDTAANPSSAPGARPAAMVAAATWPTDLGGLLVVAGPNDRRAILLLPDSAPDAEDLAQARGATLDLLAPGGAIEHATIAGVERADSTECVAWPVARLQFGRDSTGRDWMLGLRSGVASPLPRTDLGGMGTRDSSRLVVELARLASGLPGDSNPAFRGLPMIVRAATRLRLPAGGDLVIAEVVRRVGQEAKPLEERVAFVAERDSTGSLPWRASWVARIEGLEETIEAVDVVGAVVLREGTPVVVVQRESTRGVRYELLVRTGTGWERRWVGAWSGC